MNIKGIISIGIALTALAACSKPAEPVKSVDDSAAGRAAAALAASAAAGSSTDKANADLAKIREINEQEAREREAAKKSGDAISAAMAKGAAKPLRDLKY
jgi:hypothetical protein